MSPIVFGWFDTMAKAQEAERTLHARGFSVWEVSVFSAAAQPPTDGREAGAETRVVLAVCARRGNASVATDVLREAGARDPERTQGQWDTGRWTDFDAATHGTQGTPGRAAPRVAREAVECESTGNEDPGSELEHYVDHQRSGED
ncbi:hypothetical protein [Cupriavidus pinatubonensis]|uniref:Uncharacterized protein n=1 Tax=Cupriavidus pinatubonensis TaxID=248026 RepID=A0ABM8Y3H7_9BURK|nr:hypothetical protein [Cupriavidus pinatubonensis]CAG9187318.1 hypothetical protein LMG23994_06763 [Cupriavidus pinatubonensis]